MTGSHIPGVQTAASVYTVDRLAATGRDGNLGAALQKVDPAVTIHR
jgi:hypothetical protein